MNDLQDSGMNRKPPRWLRPVVYAAVVLFIVLLLSPLGQRLGVSRERQPENHQLGTPRTPPPVAPGVLVMYVWFADPELPPSGEFESRFLQLSNLLKRHATILAQTAGQYDRMKMLTGMVSIKPGLNHWDKDSSSKPVVYLDIPYFHMQAPRDDLFDKFIETRGGHWGGPIRRRLVGRNQLRPRERRHELLADVMNQASSARLSHTIVVILTSDTTEEKLLANIARIESANTKVMIANPNEFASTQPAAGEHTESSAEVLRRHLEDVAMELGWR